MFFLAIKPQQVAFAAAQKRCVDAGQLGNDEMERQAGEALKAAIANASSVQETYQAQMRRRMPDLNFQDRELGMLSWWREARNLMPMLSSFAKDPGVVDVQSGFSMPELPWSPNDPLFNQDVIVIPLGQVSVVGDFKSLMNNIRRWNMCPRLVMIDSSIPPALSGSSPNLTMTYAVKCVIFPTEKGGDLVRMAGTGQPGGQGGVPMPAYPMPGPAMTGPPTAGTVPH